MVNDELAIELSAYADGELSPARARELEARLNAEPALRRELELFGRMDREAAAIPVPQIGERLSSPAKLVSDSKPLNAKLKSAASEAPAVSPQRFDALWKKISAQTVSPSEADRQSMMRSARFDGESSEAALQSSENAKEIAAWRKLDDTAAALAIPQMSDLAAREIWHGVAEQTGALNPAQRRNQAKLESAAAAIKVPEISDARFAACWGRIAEQLAQTPAELREELAESAPSISDERWNTMWKAIAARTKIGVQKPAFATKIPPRTSNLCMPAVEMHEMPVKVESKAESNVVPVEFSKPAARPRRWGWIAAAASAAAAILLGVYVFLHTGNSESPTAFQIPESLDERYGVQVQYLEGQKEPVVCFFLKSNDEEKIESKVKDWQWLPD